jgi:hypothetical protein
MLAVLVAVYVWLSGSFRRNLCLSLLSAYAGLLCLAGAVTRSDVGLFLAFDTRYFVISLTGWICLVLCLTDRLVPTRRSIWIGTAGVLSVWALVWLLYYQDVRRFSDELAALRELFVTRQAPEAIVWGNQNENRERGMQVLWASYLSGVRPMAELWRNGSVRLPERILAAVATEGSDPGGGDSRAVADFLQDGDDLILSRPGTFAGAGTIYLQDGLIWVAANPGAGR